MINAFILASMNPRHWIKNWKRIEEKQQEVEQISSISEFFMPNFVHSVQEMPQESQNQLPTTNAGMDLLRFTHQIYFPFFRLK
jgi:hypothetical protein